MFITLLVFSYFNELSQKIILLNKELLNLKLQYKYE